MSTHRALRLPVEALAESALLGEEAGCPDGQPDGQGGESITGLGTRSPTGVKVAGEDEVGVVLHARESGVFACDSGGSPPRCRFPAVGA